MREQIDSIFNHVPESKSGLILETKGSPKENIRSSPRNGTPRGSPYFDSIDKNIVVPDKEEESEPTAAQGKASNAIRFFQNLATNIQTKFQEKIVDKFQSNDDHVSVDSDELFKDLKNIRFDEVWQ